MLHINTQHQNMADVLHDKHEKNTPLEPSATPYLKIENEEGKDAFTKPDIAENSVKKEDFDTVSLEDGDISDEDGDDEDDDDGGGKNEKKPKKKRLKKKKPKHVAIEEDSSSDDDENAAAFMDVNPSDLTWLLWMWYYVTAVSSGALKAAEFLGEKLATFFGITTPKYQYVIDEYYRLKELEKDEEEKEQKEKEFIAQRKMDELARLEGGAGQSVVSNEQ